MSRLADRIRFRWDHRWAPGHMSAFIDRELAPGRRRRMEHHLDRCPECRSLLHGLRRMLDALSALPAPRDTPEPLSIAASVRVRLDQPPAS
jgi:anti-sigma factor RsiW